MILYAGSTYLPVVSESVSSRHHIFLVREVSSDLTRNVQLAGADPVRGFTDDRAADNQSDLYGRSSDPILRTAAGMPSDAETQVTFPVAVSLGE